MRIPRKLKKRLKKANELRIKRENALKAIQTLLLLTSRRLLLTSMRSNALILQAAPNISIEMKVLEMAKIAIDFASGLQKIYS